MEWSKRNEYRWESGPFTIELVSPKRWVLTRSEAIDDHVLSDGKVWTGSSLRRLKDKAEALAADAETSEDRRRTFSIGAFALFVLLIVASQPGPVAATVAIMAFGVLLFSLIRAIDHAISARPWDVVGEKYQ